MESSNTKFTEEVPELNESFQQLKSDLAITKNVNSQVHNYFINKCPMPNILGENVWE